MDLHVVKAELGGSAFWVLLNLSGKDFFPESGEPFFTTVISNNTLLYHCVNPLNGRFPKLATRGIPDSIALIFEPTIYSG